MIHLLDRLLDGFAPKPRVLMVCTENICRSPMAEGLLRWHLQRAGLARRFTVDSAGTRTSQPGVRPDQRAQRVALAAGVDISRIRARRIAAEDFERCDYRFAMDRKNLRDLEDACPEAFRHKLGLLLADDPAA